MNTERKAQLVQDWGFQNHVGSIYYRTIYKDEGYLEKWTESQPDVIQFIKDGEWSHDYEIDWSLFN